jgi:hypothetical protein
VTKMSFVSKIMIEPYSILTLCGERSRHDLVYIDCIFCDSAQKACQIKEIIRDAEVQ